MYIVTFFIWKKRFPHAYGCVYWFSSIKNVKQTNSETSSLPGLAELNPDLHCWHPLTQQTTHTNTPQPTCQMLLPWTSFFIFFPFLPFISIYWLLSAMNPILLSYIRRRGISLESSYCLPITCHNLVLKGFLTGFETLLQPATSLFRERLLCFGSADKKSLCSDPLMTEGSQIVFLSSKKVSMVNTRQHIHQIGPTWTYHIMHSHAWWSSVLVTKCT